MSQRNPPKPLFKQRRPASATLESMASVRFRQAMYAENAAEIRRDCAHDLEAFALIRSAGFNPHSLDMDGLIGCSRLEGIVDVAGEVLLMVNPAGPCMDHMAFDRTVCEAGVTRYVRRTMPSDRPGQGTPIDPRTGRPDRTIPIPNVDFGEFVLVQELSKGLRHRVPVVIRRGADALKEVEPP
jgi:hypothetical protein